MEDIGNMKLTAQIKLLPTPEQRHALAATIRQVNAACGFLSAAAWEGRVFGRYGLQKAAYYQVREQFNLSAQMTVRAIAKVADAYKLDRCVFRTFRLGGAIAYDGRVLRYLKDGRVSIWTSNGRHTIPYTCGERQRELLAHQKGESDLVLRDGEFYLTATCEVEEPEPVQPKDALGVDLGIVNVAVDSDGRFHTGERVRKLRERHHRLRAKLQKKGTKAAKRLLRKRHRKEARFGKDVNHCISKELVARAKCTNRAIALEDLKGIRRRVKARREQRRELGTWSFHQLRKFIEYKARLEGVSVVLVDPKNTSRTCPECGFVSKANRPERDRFRCVECAFSGEADHIAAINIGRAAVNQPDAAASL